MVFLEKANGSNNANNDIPMKPNFFLNQNPEGLRVLLQNTATYKELSPATFI